MNSILFEPVKLAGLVLKNRFLMSAAAGWKTTESGDIEADRPIIHYQVAGGGPALINGGGIGVHASARRGPTSGVFNHDDRIPSYRVFARRVQEGGAAASFQITHSGMWAGPYQQKIGAVPFAPSFIVHGADLEYDSSNREECPATGDRIREIISAYGDAAARAKRAGFDAVQVHGAHDSLLAQFLSPFTNQRRDQWGGDVEGRCRFHREVMADIRGKVGPDFPVILKLGVQDMKEGGLMLEEGIAAAALLAEDGNLDAIEVSQGLSPNGTDLKLMSIRPGITSVEKEAYYREWTMKVKQALRETVQDRVLIIVQGGLRSFELMEEIVHRNEADLVSMCRPYICEPGLINRWIAGDLGKATCISCNRCAIESSVKGQLLACMLNSAS